MSILLDAGPALNFLGVGQQNLLIQLARSPNLQLATASRVSQEILGICSNDPRFNRTGARRTWKTLTAAGGRIALLDDTLETQRFTDAVTRIAGVQASARVRDRKSLGEILVLAHASIFVQGGLQVYVLMDESDGRIRAQKEAAFLAGIGARGNLRLWRTPQVLKEAGRRPGWINGGLTWQQVYDQMAKLDDGLPPRR